MQAYASPKIFVKTFKTAHASLTVGLLTFYYPLNIGIYLHVISF